MARYSKAHPMQFILSNKTIEVLEEMYVYAFEDDEYNKFKSGEKYKLVRYKYDPTICFVHPKDENLFEAHYSFIEDYDREAWGDDGYVFDHFETLHQRRKRIIEEICDLNIK